MRPMLALFCALFASSVSARVQQSAVEKYRALPLRFEQRAAGQFIARGEGHAVMLRSDAVILAPGTALRFSSEASRIGGEEPLAGTVSYFIGRDPAQWRRNVPAFAKVRYHSIARGVDLLFYGNQRELEFDLIVAPHADAKRIRFAVDGANVSKNTDGDVVLRFGGRELFLRKPVVYQSGHGARELRSCAYRLIGNGAIALEIGPYDHSRTLVIDPTIQYARAIGGSADDVAYAVAADAAGNSYITGKTTSTDFPTHGAPQTTNGGASDVFVAKISADGSSLLYSTYLGGSGDDAGLAIAVDGSGNATVAGRTASSNFPLASALQSTFSGSTFTPTGFVAALNASGSALVYSTYFGGSNTYPNAVAVDASGNAYIAGQAASIPATAGAAQQFFGGFVDAFAAKINAGGASLAYATYLGGNQVDYAYGIAVDGAGNAYVSGTTDSPNFPTTSALRSTGGGGPIATTDGGTSWHVANTGFLKTAVSAFAFDPTNAARAFANDGRGLYRTIDGGAHWTQVINGGAYFIDAVAVDPTNPLIVYAGANFGDGVRVSTDGGSTFNGMNTGLTNPNVLSIAIDPSNHQRLLAGTTAGVFLSTDGAATWTATSLTSGRINAIAFDPTTPANVYAALDNGGVSKSTNGGATWATSSTGLPFGSVRGVAVNPSNGADVLAASDRGLYRSTTSGASWTAAASSLGSPSAAFAAFWTKATPSIIFGGTAGTFESTDGGTTWRQLAPHTSPTAFAFAAGTPSTALIASDQNDAFIVKINPAGSALVYSTYFGGVGDERALDIAVDGSGNATIAGYTGSLDFPTTAAASQTVFGGGATDAFVARLGPTGSALVYSTLYGGTGDDEATGIALDAATGKIFIAGDSTSSDLPLSHPFQPNGPGNVYKSFDGGATWSGREYPGQAFAIDPTDSFEMYSLSAGVKHSTDSGVTWTALASSPTDATQIAVALDEKVFAAGPSGVYRSADHGGTWTNVLSASGFTKINSMVLDPIAIANGDANGDGGVTAGDVFYLINTLFAGGPQPLGSADANGDAAVNVADVFYLISYLFGGGTAPSSNVNTGVVLATDSGIRVSPDGGSTWYSSTSGLPSGNVDHVRTDPANQNVLYASHSLGVYKSTDLGKTWLSTGTLTSGVAPYDIAVDPANSSIVYVGSKGGGVYKSTSGGTTWTAINSSGLTSPNINSIVAAGSPTTVYVGTDRSLFSTSDGGTTWVRAGLTNLFVGAITETRGPSPLLFAAAPPIRSGFIAVLDPTASSSLVSASYFGGSSDSVMGKMFRDGSGATHVPSSTAANDVGVTGPRLQSAIPIIESDKASIAAHSRPMSTAGSTSFIDAFIDVLYDGDEPQFDLGILSITYPPVLKNGNQIGIVVEIKNYGPDPSPAAIEMALSFEQFLNDGWIASGGLTFQSFQLSNGSCQSETGPAPRFVACSINHSLAKDETMTIGITGTLATKSSPSPDGIVFWGLVNTVPRFLDRNPDNDQLHLRAALSK